MTLDAWDRGPWEVVEWDRSRVVLQSEDFRHDVALEISGDFAEHADKLRYAIALCSALNATIPPVRDRGNK